MKDIKEKIIDNSFNSGAKGAFVGKIAFLLLSFPLGIFYFVLTITGFSLGMGTLVIWIGLPILFATLFLVRVLGEVERRLVGNLLHMPISYRLPDQRVPGQGFLKRFGKLLTDPYTWTSMIYIILKLPLGILNFTLTVTLTCISIALTLMPLGYLINLLVNTILLANGVVSSSIIIPHFIEIHGTFDPTMFIRTFISVPVGILFWLITRNTLAILALKTGELARPLRGPGEAIAAWPHEDLHNAAQRPQELCYVAPMVMREQQANID